MERVASSFTLSFPTADTHDIHQGDSGPSCWLIYTWGRLFKLEMVKSVPDTKISEEEGGWVCLALASPRPRTPFKAEKRSHLPSIPSIFIPAVHNKEIDY